MERGESKAARQEDETPKCSAANAEEILEVEVWGATDRQGLWGSQLVEGLSLDGTSKSLVDVMIMEVRDVRALLKMHYKRGKTWQEGQSL